MNRDDIVKCIYSDLTVWTCPELPTKCSKAQSQTSEDSRLCFKCAHDQLANYEAELLDEFMHTLSFDTAHMEVDGKSVTYVEWCDVVKVWDKLRNEILNYSEEG